MSRLVSLGYNNFVAIDKIIGIVSATALPSKRLIEESRRRNKLIDATSGRKMRAIVVTDSDHIIVSSGQPETIAERIEGKHKKEVKGKIIYGR